MFYFYSDDGRILTPPKELKPLLKNAFSAFFDLIGHIRFLYMANEIWDGKTSLVFQADGENLAEITLEDGAFNVTAASKKFRITDDCYLNMVYETLHKTALPSQRRPEEQLSVYLDEYPNGIRCDQCLVNKIHNKNDFEGNKKFHIMDHNCYYGVEEGWGAGNFSTETCAGKTNCFYSTYACLEKKGFKNCLECGEYRTCGNCGVGHNPGECNLGITAEEVTNLIIPYCDMERLDLLRNSVK